MIVDSLLCCNFLRWALQLLLDIHIRAKRGNDLILSVLNDDLCWMIAQLLLLDKQQQQQQQTLSQESPGFWRLNWNQQQRQQHQRIMIPFKHNPGSY